MTDQGGYYGYDSRGAETALRNALLKEVISLADLILNTARGNVRYYPAVVSHLRQQLEVLASDVFSMNVTADHWQAWLEQFGKGSMMAGTGDNPGLVTYMNSDLWNRLRSRSSKVVVGRPPGRYRSMDGKTRISKGGYAGVDLEELAKRGDIDPKFGPTPPTFFLRIALQSNRQRILDRLQRVIEDFPYHQFFRVR